jgi:hypothetical protein
MAYPNPADARAAYARRDRDLYGDAIEDMELLRRRGFAVICERVGYRVDGRLVGTAELRQKAARERRLAAGSAGTPACLP